MIRIRDMGLFCISVGTVLLFPLSTNAATLASDNASDPAYTNGWTNGSNGGNGWGGGWQLTPTFNTTNEGFFVATSTNNAGGDSGNDGDIDSSGSKAWGVYANSGLLASAVRPFAGPMVPGEVFTIDMDNGYVDNGMSVGFGLQDASGSNQFEFYFPGGLTEYKIHDATDVGVGTGIGFTGGGLHLEFTLTGSNTYSLAVSAIGIGGPPGVPATFTGLLIGTNATGIARLRVWNFSACSGGSCDVFFNNIALSPPTTWYVSATSTNDPFANGTLAHPFAHIQDALNVTGPNNDTVLVFDGVYAGTGNTNLDFLGKPVSLSSINGPSNCVVDCQFTGRGFWLHHGEDNSSTINGFTVVHAASNDAAILLQSASPVINNCVFRNNGGKALAGNPLANSAIAVEVGNCLFAQNGGVAVDVGSGPVDLQNSLFVSNQSTCVSATNYGSYATINNCVFRYNQGTVLSNVEFHGQAWISVINSLIQSNAGTACSLQNGVINNSTISYNLGDGYDGTRSGYDDSGSVAMSNVIVQNNGGFGLNAAGDLAVADSTFSANGGAGFIAAPRTGLGPHGEVPQSAAIARCWFTANGSGGVGGNRQCTFNSCTSSFNSSGGIVGCGGNYVNCLIENNSGPAIALNCFGGLAAFNNCTTRNNAGLITFTGASSAQLSDSISWGNGPNPVGSLANGAFSATYCDIQYGTGQPWFGAGCIEADPDFTSDLDSHLTANSPCLFAGTSSNAPMTDIQGTPRGIPPDLGSYEFPKTDSDGDGIPDWWTSRYFGHSTGLSTDNSLARSDADSTGQNNLFKYVAGLDPTNPASTFSVRLTAVAGQPTLYNLQFSPVASGRIYSPEFSTNLAGGAWLPLTGYAGPVTNGNQITITDTSASISQKLYRVDINYSSVTDTASLVSSDITPPTTPSGATGAAASISQVTLTWGASTDSGGSGFAGYRVYRDGTLLATTTATSYSDGGLSAATTHCYTIVAYDNAGNNSAPSLQTCVTTLSSQPTDPAPPSGLAIAAVTATSVTINWQDNSGNELGFQIQRATSPDGPWTVVGSAGANATFYTDRGVGSATTYYYQVAAFN